MNRQSEILRLLGCVCLIAISFVSGGQVGAAPGDVAVDPSKMTDGNSFLSSLCSNMHKWKDYSCESHLEVYKPEKTTKSSCRFFFKAPMVRIEITEGGFKSGSVLVRQPDGAVKAKGGMMMGFITMNLDPDSRILMLPTGNNVLKTDLPTVFDELRESIAHGGNAKVSNCTVRDKDTSSDVFVLEVYEQAHSPAPPAKRIFVDAVTKMPVRIDSYKDSKLFSVAQFKHIHPNSGLGDELFKL